MTRSDLESHLKEKVEIKFFDGDIFKGFLQKTGTEEFKRNPNLYLMHNWYFLTPTENSTECISPLFRVSYVKKLKKI